MSTVPEEDKIFYEWLGGGRLLISIIFLGFGVLFVVLLVKRQLLRLHLINNKGPPDGAGHNAPKELRKLIEDSFDRIAEMRLEPKLLCDQGQHEPSYSSFVEEKDDSTYKYRRKAFDLMSCLDELLSRVHISLARKPSQSVREHLRSLQGPPYSPFNGYSELCERVTALYEHARYGFKPFTEIEYQLYSDGIDELYDRIHQKFPVPGSLLVNAEHHGGGGGAAKDSTITSTAGESSSAALSSHVVLPSELVEDVMRKGSLRFRDTKIISNPNV